MFFATRLNGLLPKDRKVGFIRRGAKMGLAWSIVLKLSALSCFGSSFLCLCYSIWACRAFICFVLSISSLYSCLYSVDWR